MKRIAPLTLCITNREAKLPNFKERATTGPEAFSEAVKGGGVLHLADEEARATQYHLVEVKPGLAGEGSK